MPPAPSHPKHLGSDVRQIEGNRKVTSPAAWDRAHEYGNNDGLSNPQNIGSYLVATLPVAYIPVIYQVPGTLYHWYQQVHPTLRWPASNVDSIDVTSLVFAAVVSLLLVTSVLRTSPVLSLLPVDQLIPQ